MLRACGCLGLLAHIAAAMVSPGRPDTPSRLLLGHGNSSCCDTAGRAVFAHGPAQALSIRSRFEHTLARIKLRHGEAVVMRKVRCTISNRDRQW